MVIVNVMWELPRFYGIKIRKCFKQCEYIKRISQNPSEFAGGVPVKSSRNFLGYSFSTYCKHSTITITVIITKYSLHNGSCECYVGTS